MKRYPTDTETFLSMREEMLIKWAQQQTKWDVVIERLPVQKYAHSRYSEHADRAPVLMLETTRGQQSKVWFGIQKHFMPLPSTCMIFPVLRYLLFSLFSIFIGDLRILS